VLTPTVATDAARRTPSAHPRAHNGCFKDEDGAVVSCLILELGVAPDATGTKGRRAKKTILRPAKAKGIIIWPGDDFDSRSKTPLK
jgi:hypothetical protein